jgi:hypothetical protein
VKRYQRLAHGKSRVGGFLVQVSTLGGDVDEAGMVGFESLKKSHLVLGPFRLDQKGLLVILGLGQWGFQVDEIKRGDVLALQEVDQIRSREKKLSLKFLQNRHPD